MAKNIGEESDNTPTQEQEDALENALNAAGITDGVTPPVAAAKEVQEEIEPVVVPPATEVPAVEPVAAPITQEEVTPPATEVPAVEPSKEIAKTTEQITAEIEALDLEKVEPPSGLSKRAAVSFKGLRDVAAHFKAKALEIPKLNERIKELETNGALTPEQKAELEDHRAFRKIFDAENNPEFKQKFDEKVATLDEDIVSFLLAKGLAKERADEIKAVGIGNVPVKWWQDEILSKADAITGQQLTKKLADRADTVEARKKEVETFASKKEEFLKGAAEREDQEAKDYSDRVTTHINSLIKDVDWAKPKEIPSGASAEEKKKIEAHNEEVKTVNALFNDALYPKTPEARAEVAAAATAAIRLSAINEEQLKVIAQKDLEIKGLNVKLEKIKGAGRIPGGDLPGKVKSSGVEVDTSKMTSDDAIEAGLRAAEGN